VDRFLDIALSFPTLILSVLLLVAVGYWLLTLLGLFDLEVLDLSDGVGAGNGGGLLSALMLKFGFGGLPFGLIYAALVSLAWLACYFVDYLFLTGLDSAMLRRRGAHAGASVPGAAIRGTAASAIPQTVYASARAGCGVSAWRACAHTQSRG
jgi:hypothetical protein